MREELVTLMERVAKQDKQAFERVYQLTCRKMFAVALRLVRDPGVAQDVLQDAYIRLWRYAGTFNAKLSAPETWLHQVVRNRALDLLAQNNPTSNSIPIEEFAEAEANDEDYAAQEAFGSDSREKAELRSTMQHCIQKLEGKYRQVLTLAYTHGMSHAEISTHLNVPLGTVKTWARRGLNELKTVYEDYEAKANSGRVARDTRRDSSQMAVGGFE